MAKNTKIDKLVDSANIADDLTPDELSNVARRVRERFELDKNSSEAKNWIQHADEAMELTRMEKSPKNWPRKDASNIKYPLLSIAQLQFSSRAAPEIIKNGQIVDAYVTGNDPTGAKQRKAMRLKKFYNAYILNKIPGFFDMIEKLLNQLSIVGTCFVDTYYDDVKRVICTKLMPYDAVFVNQTINSLEEAECVTIYKYMTTNQIIENMRLGYFRTLDLDRITPDPDDSMAVEHQLLCAQTHLDLDEDGYKEPYYVVIHDSSNEVLRITPRFGKNDIIKNEKGEVAYIAGEDYFSDIHFIMSPDGGLFGLGYGTMLLDIANTVNTAYNQLIDAGYFANTQGGIITNRCRINKETLMLERGEWIVAEGMDGTDLKDNIFPIQYREPSMVLFQLAQSMIEAAKTLTGTTEVVTGDADTTNASPNTVFALIQQSLKVNSAIIRRVLRGLSKVINKIIRIYNRHVDVGEYLRIVQPDQIELQEMFTPEGELLDFIPGDVDVVFIADKEMSTDSENLVRAQQALMAGIQLMPAGAVNFRALAYEVFRTIQLPNPELYLAPMPDPNKPDPQMVAMMAQLDLNAKNLELKQRDQRIKEMETAAKVRELLSSSVKNIADAESKEAGTQVAQYEAVLKALQQSFDMDAADKQRAVENARLQEQQTAVAAQQAPTGTGPTP